MEIIELNLTQLSTRDVVPKQLIVTGEGFKPLPQGKSQAEMQMSKMKSLAVLGLT